MVEVVVAGATGYLGRYVVSELVAQGTQVRALVRSRSRAVTPGAHGAPALDPTQVELTEVDWAQLGQVVPDGARVISALGVTRQKADPWDIDFRGNLALLRAAETAGSPQFAYISALGMDTGTSALAHAKYAFGEVLQRSKVPSQIIAPSGYFSDMASIFRAVRGGTSWEIDSGNMKLNPIHGADLAEFTVAQVRSSESARHDVGGPEVFTYREICDLVGEVVGKRIKHVSLPKATLSTARWVGDRMGPRASSLSRFFTDGLVTDAVGTPVGSRKLRDFFAELV